MIDEQATKTKLDIVLAELKRLHEAGDREGYLAYKELHFLTLYSSGSKPFKDLIDDRRFMVVQRAKNQGKTMQQIREFKELAFLNPPDIVRQFPKTIKKPKIRKNKAQRNARRRNR